jgi:hypothetical protein
MRKRIIGTVIGLSAALSLLAGPSAFAGTVVGSNCAANKSIGNSAIVSLKNPAGYPLPSAIPSAGVITSWTFNLGVPLPLGFEVSEQLKVFAPTSAPNQFKVVGESALSPVGPGITTIPTRIPVQNGDLLGSNVIVNNNGKIEQGAIFCETKDAGDEIGEVPGDPGTGATVSTTVSEAGFQNPVTVTVEPDADGDGFGDETQDKCPTDASTAGPCPIPPPPPAPTLLSATSAAAKGLVTLTVTSTAQASVSVGGSVKLGKGKTAKLSGGTQIVAPGALAKFIVLFPSKLKARLKQLTTKQSLPLKLAVSAPGATTKNLTVKVKGQKPAEPRHRKG